MEHSRCSLGDSLELFPKHKFLSKAHTPSQDGCHRKKNILFRKHKANYCPVGKVHISRYSLRATTTSGAAGDLSGSYFCLLLQGKKEKEAENPTALPLATHPQSPLKSLISVLTALFKNQL